MAETDKDSFSNVTHYTHVEVQPGGINIQHVEHFHQADILKALGIELEVKNKDPKDITDKQIVHPGAQKQFLFIANKPTEENTQVRNREKERFMHYLSDHKLSGRKLSCKKDDTLNDVVTCFVSIWQDKKLTAEEPSGGAIFRFLKDECGLQTEVTEPSYSNEIKERLRNNIYDVGTRKEVIKYFE